MCEGPDNEAFAGWGRRRKSVNMMAREKRDFLGGEVPLDAILVDGIRIFKFIYFRGNFVVRLQNN
jgi:hypothetical protein